MKDRLVRWQAVTVLVMILGYTGYYICRANLSVAMPLLIQDLSAHGISPARARVQLGLLASLGTLAYALGKLAAGCGADLLGGRRSFLAGMAGSVLFTVAFALSGGLPFFTLAWVGNRFVQSVGWVGMVKLTSRWFAYSAYARVMGIISLSYLFGDAAARKFLAVLIGHGAGWRGVFWVSAASLLFLLLLSLAGLRESPRDLGLEEPEGSPVSLLRPADKNRPRFRDLVLPFLRSPGFWILCLLSVGFHVVRETFNTWTPTYFTEALHLTKADAADKSALFPLFGGVAVLVSGFLGDRMGNRGRAAVIVWGLLLSTGALLVLGLADFHAATLLPVALTAVVGFSLLGPYSYLAGCMSLDLGGKEGSATACGLLDGAGYLGGVFAGTSIAQVSVRFGWQGAFLVLAATTAASAGLALAFQLTHRAVGSGEVQPALEPAGA